LGKTSQNIREKIKENKNRCDECISEDFLCLKRYCKSCFVKKMNEVSSMYFIFKSTIGSKYLRFSEDIYNMVCISQSKIIEKDIVCQNCFKETT